MMMQLLPVLRDSVHTSMYYTKRLLTTSCSLSLSLSLSSCTRYVPVWYGIYHTSTYRNSPGTPPIAFAYKGGVARGAKVFFRAAGFRCCGPPLPWRANQWCARAGSSTVVRKFGNRRRISATTRTGTIPVVSTPRIIPTSRHDPPRSTIRSSKNAHPVNIANPIMIIIRSETSTPVTKPAIIVMASTAANIHGVNNQ